MNFIKLNWQWIFLPVLVLIAGAFSFQAPFVLDDMHSIVKNQDITSFGDLCNKLIYPINPNRDFLNRNDPTRPFVFFTYTINYAINNLEPLGYHLFNFLLHGLNGILVFLLLKKLLPENKKKKTWIPSIAALLFALNPINMGTAMYIYGRADILWATFTFTAAYFWLHFLENKKFIYFFGVAASQAFALLCYPGAVILPLLLWMITFIYPKKENLKILNAFIFFSFISLFYLITRYLYFGALGDIMARGHWETIDYLLIQPLVFLKYLKLLIIPLGFSIDHFIPHELTFWNIAIPILICLGLPLYFYSHRKQLKNQEFKIRLFSALWFFVCLTPTSSIFPTTDAMVERRIYLASFGFYFWLSYECYRFNHFKKLIFLIFCFFSASLYRGYLHANEIRLWNAVIEEYPDNPRALFNLANVYSREKNFKASKDLYLRVLDTMPNHYYALNNLGLIYSNPESSEFNLELAAQEFQSSISINPRFELAYRNLGLTLMKLNRIEQAKNVFNEYLQMVPEDSEIQNLMLNAH